jgi:hypothetical protein
LVLILHITKVLKKKRNFNKFYSYLINLNEEMYSIVYLLYVFLLLYCSKKEIHHRLYLTNGGFFYRIQSNIGWWCLFVFVHCYAQAVNQTLRTEDHWQS